MQSRPSPPSLDLRPSAWIVGEALVGCVVALPVSLSVPWVRTAGTFRGWEQFPGAETLLAAAVLWAVFRLALRPRVPAADLFRASWATAAGYLFGAMLMPGTANRRDSSTWAANFAAYLRHDSVPVYGLTAAFAVCVWAEAVSLLTR